MSIIFNWKCVSSCMLATGCVDIDCFFVFKRKKKTGVDAQIEFGKRLVRSIISFRRHIRTQSSAAAPDETLFSFVVRLSQSRHHLINRVQSKILPRVPPLLLLLLNVQKGD